MEHAENSDSSRHDHRNHAGVVFDGVGDVLNLWHHRETMQGRPGLCYGGRSETMECSYPFAVARRAVVVTMDLSARNLHLLDTDHWLRGSTAGVPSIKFYSFSAPQRHEQRDIASK